MLYFKYQIYIHLFACFNVQHISNYLIILLLQERKDVIKFRGFDQLDLGEYLVLSTKVHAVLCFRNPSNHGSRNLNSFPHQGNLSNLMFFQNQTKLNNCSIPS